MMRASQISGLFLVAVGLPAAVVIADEWALRFVAEQHWSAPAGGMIYALFVAQVGLLGLVVGRFVRRWSLRWIILVWGLVLIDLMLFRLTMEQPHRWRDWGWGYCLPYSLLSSQLGLVAIWGIVGPVSWPWRLPGCLVAAMLVTSFGFALKGRSDVWVLLAVIQSATTVGLCVLVWCLGFRMTLPDGPGAPGREPAGNKLFQFSIGHMLVWMAALVPILLLAQEIELWFLVHLSLWDWLGLVLIALALGVVSLIAVWAALGGGPAAIRIGTLVLVPALVAIVPALVGVLFKAIPRPPPAWFRMTDELAEVGWGWLAWTLLAAWFLAGLLLMFRASGYRLVRTPRARGTGPAAENVSSDGNHALRTAPSFNTTHDTPQDSLFPDE
jgi:hypothetical protein